MSAFHKVLVNTALANVTTSYLWFALTFWVYLETRNVGVSGTLGAVFMGLVAVSSLVFGVIVDNYRKKSVMMFAALFTLVTFLFAGALWWFGLRGTELDVSNPVLWAFAVIILLGCVVEQMRNIALSTTVTLLVPEDRRDKANGLVGAVQGLAFLITSVFSGLSIGYLGMENTLWLAIALTVVAAIHLAPIKIPEEEIITTVEAAADAAHPSNAGADQEDPVAAAVVPQMRGKVDLRGSIAVIRSVPGLVALILFTCFNNFIGGTFMALLDPYGLEMFSVQVWGIVMGLCSTGFIVGGALIAKTGLGVNPVRTLLLVNAGIAVIGVVFTLREWAWLFVGGMFLFMVIMPAAEAAEQTILQRVVPFKQQGRVFGLAQAVEVAASPISAFLIAILAQSYVIPWATSDAGRAVLSVWIGDGAARGMALMFIGSGVVMAVVVALAFISRPYRRLSEHYAMTSQDLAGKAE